MIKQSSATANSKPTQPLKKLFDVSVVFVNAESYLDCIEGLTIPIAHADDQRLWAAGARAASPVTEFKRYLHN